MSLSFSFYFLRVALLTGIRGGILFKLEMFSKRITICGGVGIGNMGIALLSLFMVKMVF